MFELRLVGIGMGNPDHLTGSAKEALQGADIILIPQKGSEKSDLAAPVSYTHLTLPTICSV